MPPKAAEPTSAQPLPTLPAAQGSGQSLPFHVAIAELRDHGQNQERGRCREPHPNTTDGKAASAEYLRTRSDYPRRSTRCARSRRSCEARFRRLDGAAQGDGNGDIIHYYQGSEGRTATARSYRGTDPRDEARRRASGTWLDQLMSRKVIHSLPGPSQRAVSARWEGIWADGSAGVSRF